MVGLSKDRMWITIFREDDRGRTGSGKIGVTGRIVRCGGMVLADGRYRAVRSLFGNSL